MIIVSLVTIFLIIWAVSSFTNMSIGKRLSEQIKQQLVYKETDYMKGFSRVALIFSSHNALRDTGKLGGVTEISMERNWICTDPKVPSTDQVRYHLSKETLKYLNKYISNVNSANQRDILQYKVSKFSCVDYDVSQSGVDSGTNDVSYNIGAYGSDIEVRGEDGAASSDNDVYEEISPVRYWLMYRKFSEWAKRNVLKKEVADCLPKICDCPANTNDECGNVNNCPTFKSCVEEAVKTAEADLKNGFADSRIECRSSLMCDYTEWEECKGSDSLEVWKNAPKCNRCVLGETGSLCGRSINLDDGYTKSITANLIQEKSEKINAADRGPDQCTGKVCKYYRETRGAMEATFTCIDKKHLLSTKERNELQFTVYATVDLKKKNCPENSAIMTIDDCIWSCTKWSDTDCEDIGDPGSYDDRDSSGKCKSYVCIYEECLDCDCKRPDASGDRTLTSMPQPDTGCRWCVKEPGTPIPKTTTTSTSTTIPPRCPNLLTNSGFDGGYANTGTSINMPDSWTLTFKDNEEIRTIDPRTGNDLGTIHYFPPEANTIQIGTIPENNFFLDGDRNLKIFKGGGATWFTMCQDVSGLTPGQNYDFTINIFPDIYEGCSGGDNCENGKRFATDPAMGRVRLYTNGASGDTSWIDGTGIRYGQYNSITLLMNAQSDQAKVCIEVLSPGLYSNNWWFDAFSLRQSGISC